MSPLGIHIHLISHLLHLSSLVEPWTSQYSWKAECTGTSCSVVDAHNLSDLKQIILKSSRMVLFCRAEGWPRKCKSFVCNTVLEALPNSHGYAGRGPLTLGSFCSHIPPFAGWTCTPAPLSAGSRLSYQPGKPVGMDHFAPFRQMDPSLSKQFLVLTPAATTEGE